MMRLTISTEPKAEHLTLWEKDMRKNSRRADIESAAKIQEIRNMKQAFGTSAATAFGEKDFLDPTLVQIALSSRFERRQRLRRSMDRLESAEIIPVYK